jgi:hypothetical protein
MGLGLGVTASATVTTGVGTAAVGANAGIGVKISARIAAMIQNGENRADQEITRRITALNALDARVNAMVRLSGDEKSSLSSTIASQVSLMNTLQAQIAADAAANSTTSLKVDIQSITKSYRIFALIIPQGAIAAAADRIETTAGLLSTIGTKLQARLTDAANAGNNTSADVTALADMNAKIADANVQAQAAVTETASLQPDNGVATVMASNTATLKDARSKIMAAQADLTAARKDAGTIVKDLLSFHASTSASGTVTASSTNQ